MEYAAGLGVVRARDGGRARLGRQEKRSRVLLTEGDGREGRSVVPSYSSGSGNGGDAAAAAVHSQSVLSYGVPSSRSASTISRQPMTFRDSPVPLAHFRFSSRSVRFAGARESQFSRHRASNVVLSSSFPLRESLRQFLRAYLLFGSLRLRERLPVGCRFREIPLVRARAKHRRV